jgi:hypothetical protein
MSDANAAVVRQFVEEYQSGTHDLAVAHELLAPDLVNTIRSVPSRPTVTA